MHLPGDVRTHTRRRGGREGTGEKRRFTCARTRDMRAFCMHTRAHAHGCVRSRARALGACMTQEVTTAFEELYQGTGGKPGLKELECLLPSLQVPQSS